MANASSSPWQQWFAGPATENNHQWRVLRFAAVDAAGKPVGKPDQAINASGMPCRFGTEQAAERHARYLNAAGAP